MFVNGLLSGLTGATQSQRLESESESAGWLKPPRKAAPVRQVNKRVLDASKAIDDRILPDIRAKARLTSEEATWLRGFLRKLDLDQFLSSE